MPLCAGARYRIRRGEARSATETSSPRRSNARWACDDAFIDDAAQRVGVAGLFCWCVQSGATRLDLRRRKIALKLKHGEAHVAIDTSSSANGAEVVHFISLDYYQQYGLELQRGATLRCGSKKEKGGRLSIKINTRLICFTVVFCLHVQFAGIL